MILQYENELLQAYLAKQPKDQQTQFLSNYKQMGEDEREAVLTEINSMFKLVDNTQQQGLEFNPQPQMKYGGKKKYQNGGRKSQIAALQKSLAGMGYDMSKSKKKSGRYDGVIGTQTTKVLSQFAKDNEMSRNDAISYLMGEDSNQVSFVQKATDWFDKNPRSRATSKKTQKALASLPTQNTQNTQNPTGDALDQLSRDYREPVQQPQVNYSAEAMQMSQATGIPAVYFNSNNRTNRVVPARDIQQTGITGAVASRVLPETQRGSYSDRVNRNLQDLYNSPQYQNDNLLGRLGQIVETDPLGALIGGLGAGLGMTGFTGGPRYTNQLPAGSEIKLLPAGKINYTRQQKDLFNQARQIGYQGNLDDFVTRTAREGDFLGLGQPFYNGFKRGSLKY